MNIVAIGAFRNKSALIDRYFTQIYELDYLLSRRCDSLSLILGYGDSTDDTDALLFERTSAGIGARLVDCTHGGPEYSSIVHPGRFQQLAFVANRMWSQIPEDADVVLVVEPDLIWQAETMVALIDRLEDYPAVAPMVYLNREGWPPKTFYDRFAYRKNGKQFDHLPPYFDGWPVTKPVRVDSAGSCMAMNGGLARHLTWPVDVFVGVCKKIYALGASVWLDPNLTVIHE